MHIVKLGTSRRKRRSRRRRRRRGRAARIVIVKIRKKSDRRRKRAVIETINYDAPYMDLQCFERQQLSQSLLKMGQGEE